MKKIIALAMSALLAVSSVALPVSAEPAASVSGEIGNMDWSQARPVSSEELAQVRAKANTSPEEIPEATVMELPESPVNQEDGSEVIVIELPESPVNQEVLTYQAAAKANQAKDPPPVLAHVTSDTVVLEPAPGCHFSMPGVFAYIQSSNVFQGLKPNTTYKCYIEIPGTPSRRSEPLVFTTKDRVPCVATPQAPIVEEFSSTSICLVDVPGYEYRMADGEWQESPFFKNLEPETEYTFYQRIMESNTEFASAESEPLRCKTSHVGPSSGINLAQLVQFINENGTEDEEGYKTVAYLVTDDFGTEYYFLLFNKGGEVWFEVFSYSEASDTLLFDTRFPLDFRSASVWVYFTAALYSSGVCVDYVESDSSIYMTDYKIGDPVTVYNSSEYLSAEDLSSLCTSTTEMLFGFWDEFIYTTLGFGFRGLGFVRTEGYGDLYCHAAVDAHFGELVTVNQRESGCLVNGSEGDLYCTLCGQTSINPNVLPSRRSHLYDNDCDTQCNDCGHIRIVPHIYSYACDVHCDICGAVRAKPLSAHIFDANRICTKCGLEGHLLGDISGDGKVNLGDVSRVYAHTTGKTLLTDPYELAAADTNGDGKINLGDTSRILSHVRGTKLLW